ncbi:MAG TPA: helix-turn-helix transcriptional regulator [Pseudonocardiaceae bacterium]|jgi:transcriptional regulator with XRE-family HTH domain|nr:helix-turn-helix transcriptional regulator [Pseudonocardiaceae bacterium]
MATKSSPTLLRRRVARKLRRMREAANLTLAEAAPLLDKTRSALGRIENAETVADVHLVRSMMDLYDQFDTDLLDLVRQAMRPGWWVAYGVRDRGFIGLETEASTSLDFQLMYVPGLLQTEAYMRAVFSTGKVGWSRKELENQITARLIRQKRLMDDTTPLALTAIVDEAVLRKPVDGSPVMRAQLHHLFKASQLETVTLQVLPDSLGAHLGMDGAFTILEFADEEYPSLLYVEYPTGGVHVERPAEVREAKLIFDKLRSAALPPQESAAFIERTADERYPS